MVPPGTFPGGPEDGPLPAQMRTTISLVLFQPRAIAGVPNMAANCPEAVMAMAPPLPSLAETPLRAVVNAWSRLEPPRITQST